MLLSLLGWLSPASALILPVDVCEANLVFVGTMTSETGYFLIPPGTNPRHPDGKISTHHTFSVSRVVLDATGDAADGVVTVSLPGGQVGTNIQDVPEMPAIDTGDRYAFALRWVAGWPHPLVLGWTYVAPDVQLPSASELHAEWQEHCNGQ